MVIVHVEKQLAENDALSKSVEVNPPEKAKLSFEQFLNKIVNEMIDDHTHFYKKFVDDEGFQSYFVEALYQRYLEERRPRASVS